MSQASAAARFTYFFEIMRQTFATSLFFMRGRYANPTAGSFISGVALHNCYDI
jgi:hypothetical protein